ncbi:MAG: hypothetical protein WAM30_14150 [Candidatus Dormiibacterota bacterium]
MTENERAHGPLTAEEFAVIAATLPESAVVERLRALDHLEFMGLRRLEIDAAYESLDADDPDPVALEPQARRLDLLADAAPNDYYLEQELNDDLRELAQNLRRAPEYLAELEAEARADELPETLQEAIALVGSCDREGTVEERLQQVNAVIVRLGELARQSDEATADAIRSQGSEAWHIRESLELRREDGAR